jgi:hypothetical protein
LSGYGITDAQSMAKKGVANGYASLDASGKLTAAEAPAVAFTSLTGKPTTLTGYGITDALDLSNAQTISGAKTFADPVTLGGQTAEPTSPSDGTIWYNSTTAQLKAQIGGTAKVLQPVSEVFWLTPVAGDHVATALSSSSPPSVVLQPANTLRLYPFTSPADIDVRGLSIFVSTPTTAALTRLVIYDADAYGRPNALVIEPAAVDCSTAGVKTASVNLTFQRGQTYWLGARLNLAVALLSWQGSATPDINGGAPTSGLRKSVIRALAYGTTLPSPWNWSASEISGFAPTAIWLKL